MCPQPGRYRRRRRGRRADTFGVPGTLGRRLGWWLSAQQPPPSANFSGGGLGWLAGAGAEPVEDRACGRCGAWPAGLVGTGGGRAEPGRPGATRRKPGGSRRLSDMPGFPSAARVRVGGRPGARCEHRLPRPGARPWASGGIGAISPCRHTRLRWSRFCSCVHSAVARHLGWGMYSAASVAVIFPGSASSSISADDIWA